MTLVRHVTGQAPVKEEITTIFNGPEFDTLVLATWQLGQNGPKLLKLVNW